MDEASCNMASDCRARTESGSIIRRMTTTTDTVNTTPAAPRMGTGASGMRKAHTRVTAAMAAMVTASISWLNLGMPIPRVHALWVSWVATTPASDHPGC